MRCSYKIDFFLILMYSLVAVGFDITTLPEAEVVSDLLLVTASIHLWIMITEYAWYK